MQNHLRFNRAPRGEILALNDNNQLQDYDELWRGARVSIKAVKEFIVPSGTWSKIRRFILGDVIEEEIQPEASQLLFDLDFNYREHIADEIGEEPWLPTTMEDKVTRARYGTIAAAVAACKMELPGVGEESKANRLVAHRFIKNYMIEIGMRPTHIAAQLPLAVECVFVPNRFEVEAMKFRQSHAFIDRREEASRVYISRSSPWLFNWFGSRRRVEPEGTN